MRNNAIIDLTMNVRLYLKINFFSLDIQFVLKRWWALWCISRQNKNKSKLKYDELFYINKIWKPYTDNPKIIIDENVRNA